MKHAKHSEKPKKDNFLVKFLVLGLVVFLFWMLFVKSSSNLPNVEPPKITQVTAQLSAGKNGEWGTASKTTNGVDFGVNVTAFLPKTTKGFDYYVYLKGNGGDLKDMLLGKMVLSGDVYSLNYKTDMDYFGYTEVVVVKQTEADSKLGKTEPAVLTGMFAKQ